MYIQLVATDTFGLCYVRKNVSKEKSMLLKAPPRNLFPQVQKLTMFSKKNTNHVLCINMGAYFFCFP